VAIIKCDGVNCWCHLEWHCEHAGLARVFEGHHNYGDPYCYALPYVVRERFDEPRDGKKGLVEFIGVNQVMKPCQYRAMRAAMRAAGSGRVEHEDTGRRETDDRDL